MNKVRLCIMLIVGYTLALAACGREELTVKICRGTECGKDPIEVLADGGTIALRAEANQPAVSFQWDYSGNIQLPEIYKGKSLVQFILPLSLTAPEEIPITVTVTDTNNRTARADTTLRLLPPVVSSATAISLSPEASAVVTPSPTPRPTASPTPTPRPTPRPVQTLPVSLNHFQGRNSCSVQRTPSGDVTLTVYADGSLTVTVRLENLQPNHTYTPSLNEQEAFRGEIGEQRGGQEHYDLRNVRTDGDSNISENLPVELRPGRYHLKFLIKDPDAEYCIVLHNDKVEFTVPPTQ